MGLVYPHSLARLYRDVAERVIEIYNNLFNNLSTKATRNMSITIEEIEERRARDVTIIRKRIQIGFGDYIYEDAIQRIQFYVGGYCSKALDYSLQGCLFRFSAESKTEDAPFFYVEPTLKLTLSTIQGDEGNSSWSEELFVHGDEVYKILHRLDFGEWPIEKLKEKTRELQSESATFYGEQSPYFELTVKSSE